MKEENIGVKIKLLREQNKMTQHELANRLNVTRQAVSNWERGKTTPDIDSIQIISEIFAVSIDEIISGEIGKMEKQYNRKGTVLLYISSIILVMLNIVVSALAYKEMKMVTIFPIGILLFIETIIFFTFGNAIKNDDFSIISGYDSRIEYNIAVLKKMLVSIENHVMISSTIFIGIMIGLGHITVPKVIGGIIVVVYTLEFITSIILINVKNQEYLFKNQKEVIQSKISNCITIIFIIFLFLCIGVMIFCMEYYHIENNSLDGTKMLAIMFPYICLILGSFFYEQQRVKKYIENDKPYLPSKVTYVIMILCIVLLIVMVLVADKLSSAPILK